MMQTVTPACAGTHAAMLAARGRRGAAPRHVPRTPDWRRVPILCRAADQDRITNANAVEPLSQEEPPTTLSLEERIASGEFTQGSTKVMLTKPLKAALKEAGGPGRFLALKLASTQRQWMAAAAAKMPEASGDVREIIGQPVFVPLYNLFRAYGRIFRLSFGPQTFVVISDNELAKEILLTSARLYSKGILAEILAFVMGTGLIPADGDIARERRRAIAPALHKKYVTAMVGMFGECADRGLAVLDAAADAGRPVEMESFFSRYALDVIGKAVFNFDFDSLTTDSPVIKAVYTVLREAEYRSITPLPYWKIPVLGTLVPRQRRCQEALVIVNDCLDGLVARCSRIVREENEEFVEEYLNRKDPSILHFLLASGETVSSKQLRDDLMTMLIAGHETTAAVLTWTLHLLAQHPAEMDRLQREVDAVIGDRRPTVDDVRALSWTTRAINEGMRLYPQPPVLIRRAMEDTTLGGYPIRKGQDIFISVWNIHHSPVLWDDPESFKPERFGPIGAVPNEFTEDYRFLPFGAGPRKCIGDQFALLEAVAMLAIIVRRYTFTKDPASPAVGMTTGATIHTTAGLHMLVARRIVAPSQGAPAASEGSGGATSNKCPMGFGAAAASPVPA